MSKLERIIAALEAKLLKVSESQVPNLKDSIEMSIDFLKQTSDEDDLIGRVHHIYLGIAACPAGAAAVTEVYNVCKDIMSED